MARNTERFGNILERILCEARWGRRVSEGRALFLWKEIVGDSLQAHTRPLRIENGKMVVAVDDSLWKQEVALLQSEIIGKLNERMGRDVVSDLRLVVRR